MPKGYPEREDEIQDSLKQVTLCASEIQRNYIVMWQALDKLEGFDKTKDEIKNAIGDMSLVMAQIKYYGDDL